MACRSGWGCAWRWRGGCERGGAIARRLLGNVEETRDKRGSEWRERRLVSLVRRLRAFVRELRSRHFDVAGYEHLCRLWTIVLEISVMMAQYPSRRIAELSYRYRTLGLGYANIGGLLMTMGLPYDGDTGRAFPAERTFTEWKQSRFGDVVFRDSFEDDAIAALSAERRKRMVSGRVTAGRRSSPKATAPSARMPPATIASIVATVATPSARSTGPYIRPIPIRATPRPNGRASPAETQSGKVRLMKRSDWSSGPTRARSTRSRNGSSETNMRLSGNASPGRGPAPPVAEIRGRASANRRASCSRRQGAESSWLGRVH